MKSLSSLPQVNPPTLRPINFLFDKSVLTALVLTLFASVQSLSLWRSRGDVAQLTMTLILYGSALYFYYQRRRQLRFPRQLVAQTLGGILLGLMVFKLLTLYRADVTAFWGFAPALAIVGLILVAAGFYGVKQFWRLLVILFLFAGILTRIYWFIEGNASLTVLSAKISSLALWYVGFESSTQGQLVYVNGGAIDIYNGCTAFPLFFTCIELLLILYFFYPSSRNSGEIFLYVAFAFVLTFILSIIRLCIMALVVNDAPKFEYWHGTAGSNLFMTLSLIGCGLFALMRMSEPSSAPSLSLEKPLQPSAPREWIVKGYLSLIAVALILLILWPDGAARRIAAYQFPETINLSGWRLERSQPVSTEAMGFFLETQGEEKITPERIQEEQDQQQEPNILMAAQRYFYQQNQISLESVLTYVINSDATLPHFNHPDFLEKAYQEQLAKAKANTPYLMVTGKEKTHLTSCLTSGGESIVTNYDFLRVSRIRNTLFNPPYFIDWLRGKRLMWDRRCLWVHLAAPSSSPDVEEHLLSAWKDLRDYWRRSFPPF
ncbi:MAG: hypothetical protein GC158_16690 [Cyanobacteria bacterium RI_101]|nr:hypothetical protein [Cyanobacteria bacterium RI_101]